MLVNDARRGLDQFVGLAVRRDDGLGVREAVPAADDAVDIEEIVDRLVERVEERVIAELERRGVRGGAEVF